MSARLLLVLAIVLAACGGAGAPSAGTPGPGGTTGSGEATASPGDGEAGPAFADLIRQGALATYKITYVISLTGGESDGAMQQTWYFKPPNARYDLSDPESSDVISMFMLSTGTYMCTTTEGQSYCFQSSTDAAAGQDMALSFQTSFQDDPDAFGATLRETRSIAGQQAFCYAVGLGVLGGDGTFCYNAAGVPLLSQWSADGQTWKMEATAFSTSVPDSDFELPAPAQSY